MANGKKIISAVLLAGMVLTLLPVISGDREEADKTEDAAAIEADAVNTAQKDSQALDNSYTLLISAIDAEDYEAAKSYLDECFALCDPEADPVMYADLLLKQACIAVIEEKNDEALQTLAAALEVQPDLADAYLVRAQVYVAQDKISDAVRDLEEYIELTGDASLYETVAQLYESQGGFTEAQTAYEMYVSGTGGDPAQAGIQSGIYRMEAGSAEEAAAVFENYLDSETYGAEAAYYIGICRMSLEDYTGAMDAFDACMEKGGDFEGVYFNRGVCSLVSDDWETAAEYFEKSVESEPYTEDALYNLGVCQMQMEDYASAVITFTVLIGDGEQDEVTGADQAAGDEVYYCRAMCHAMLGELEAALSDYTVCIDHGYESAQCYAQRAEVYAALGDTENYNSDLQNAQAYEE